MGNKNREKKKMSRFKLRKLKKAISACLPRSKGLFMTTKCTVEQYSEATATTSGLETDVCNGNSPITLHPVDLQASATKDDTEKDDVSLIIEEENKTDEFQQITGRRIVDLNFLLRELQEKGRHSDLFDCKSNYFRLIGEKRVGLTSVFKFQCDMCQKICLIHSEDTNNTEQVNLNIAATTGIVASGIGFSQFEELCSSMDVPIFSPNYYSKLQNEVYEKWEKTASASMEAAAAKEKEMAIAEGRIENGYPVIDVYVDGSWCARSYGTNYKASSGTAAIIGRRTGQVIYIGVKNKYCLMCARAENKNIAPKEHACFKNYQGSSSSMETAILVEGFKSSVSMYGLVYKKMIGDGDASTYEKILKANPYEAQNITVEKIECRNHILRNFCKKMRTLKTESKYALVHRKTLTDIKIMSMRKAIVKCIKHHNGSKSPRSVAISVLHNDIVNSLPHAYGDHKMCQSYYCDKKENNNDELKKIQNSTFAFRINAIVSNVAAKSRSLIEDVDTNIVECFNSVIAKFIGGKRANFALKQGYQGRCSAAVVSFNSKSAISSVQKEFTTKKPSARIEEMEKKRALKRKHFVEQPVKKSRRFKETNKKQHDYGPSSSAPDMTHEDMEMAKEQFMKNLQSMTSDKTAIERGTILQRESSEWLEIRKKLITASNFGTVCKRKPSSNTANLVKSILYQKSLAHVTSIAHGVENEKLALLQLQRQEHLEILPCGLFIDPVHPFIGASPDGLIGQDMIVEIKCPFSAAKIGLATSIEQNKIQILKYNKNTKTYMINKKSNWYFQIQGQLHVTGRQVCLLGIWAGENEPLFTERINRDDKFWRTYMEPKLVQFYFKCLLPELVDSRYKRGMPIRNLTLEANENEQPSSSIQDLQQSGLSTRKRGMPLGNLVLQSKRNKQPSSSIRDLQQPGASTHKQNMPKINLALPAVDNEQPLNPIQDLQQPGLITRVINISEF